MINVRLGHLMFLVVNHLKHLSRESMDYESLDYECNKSLQKLDLLIQPEASRSCLTSLDESIPKKEFMKLHIIPIDL